VGHEPEHGTGQKWRRRWDMIASHDINLSLADMHVFRDNR
jgi:hypothetical protein